MILKWDDIFLELSQSIVLMQQEIVGLKEANRACAEQEEQKQDSLFQGILEVIDLCERLLEQEDSASLRRTLRKLERLLKEHNIEEMHLEHLDPYSCRVVETRSDASLPEGAILSVIRRGFRRKEKIVRLMDVISNKITSTS